MVMLQCQQNLNGLQRDMRRNALTWRAAAVAQTTAQPALAQQMSDAAIAYQGRLGWLTTLQADATNWPKVRNMFIALGGTAADFTAMLTPITAVANQLGPADKSTYTAIISDCDQILAAVEAPLNLWPEGL